MPKYDVTLRGSRLVARETRAFDFDLPQGFTYKAGQSIDLTLLNPPETDGEGNTRAFTIASAPAEQKLMVTTRLRNTAFKRVLRSLAPGSHVGVDGPFGSMTLHSAANRPAVFLAGGIGITPFRSMVVQAASEAKEREIVLFYANHRREDAAFLDELRTLARSYRSLTLIPTLTKEDASTMPWNGELGRPDLAMIQRYVSSLRGPVYYVAGPPAMVGAMRTMLNGAGVEDDDIRSEEFSGYDRPV